MSARKLSPKLVITDGIVSRALVYYFGVVQFMCLGVLFYSPKKRAYFVSYAHTTVRYAADTA
jgi:hypothetical protein